MKRKSRSARRNKHSAAHTQDKIHSEICRLCHGRFSSQKLQRVFGTPSGSPEVLPPRFSADFQQLLGVSVHRDSALSPYICTDCHAQFYQCNTILQSFIHCVNSTPSHTNNAQHRHTTHTTNSTERRNSKSIEPHSTAPPITLDSRCLLRLVWWAHEHAEGCASRPGLWEVLDGECGGAVQAVWSCDVGHAYIMDSAYTCETDRDHALNSTHPAEPIRDTPTDGATGGHEVSSPVQHLEDSDLSDRNFSSDDEMKKSADAQTDTRNKRSSKDVTTAEPKEKKKPGPKPGWKKKLKTERNFSSDGMKKSADAQTDTRKRSKDVTTPEPKEKKKPGPKPGWKKKLKTEREDLPTIYKCPHQGCTAVYRGVDGMRKHVKEHHEEVRERPCPHPGCNKVFMIDRYLQRHVKLIHTEVRNYICDQCGQTFKQRKHLSVHQMRHSGAKPLQCEVCGFQCRQRASLKYHMTKHKAEAELEFACGVCERRFEKAHNLNVHMSMMHPLLQDSAPSDTPAMET